MVQIKGYYFQVFWVKNILNKLENLRLKSKIPILANILVLLDVQANLPETSLFFSCPNGFGKNLFSNVYNTWDV